MISLLAIIERALDLLAFVLKKALPDSQEKEGLRKQRAKENWDKLMEQERRVREKLYGGDANR